MPSKKVKATVLRETTINIGPFVYRVLLMSGAFKHPEDTSHTIIGFCDANAQTIQVAASRHPQQQWTTFWHEVAHAWTFNLHTSEVNRPNLEEIANFIAVGMACLSIADISRMSAFFGCDEAADSVDRAPVRQAAKRSRPIFDGRPDGYVSADLIAACATLDADFQEALARRLHDRKAEPELRLIGGDA